MSALSEHERPDMGYANPVLTLNFDHLSEDPANDRIWVALHNPKIMPPDRLRPRELPAHPDGTPVVSDDAMAAMYEIVAGLIIGWRAYDATAITLDANGVPSPQPLLPTPATPELVRRLPMEIINAIAEQIRQATVPS